MIRATINGFMWVWALCPVCRWQLPSAQCLPLAHQPRSRKEAPGCSAVFPPSHISQLEMWGLFGPHLPGLAPEHAAVQPSALQMWTLLVEALHLEGLWTCACCRPEEWLDHRASDWGEEEGVEEAVSFACLFFWGAIEKTKEFSVIPGLVLGFVFGVGFFSPWRSIPVI